MECPRRDRWIRGCHFEARYDLAPARLPKATHDVKGSGGAVSAFLEGFRQKTYVRDVCVTCGAVRERAPVDSN
jgi:hypothetical protein